jgi:hypothetical protein
MQKHKQQGLEITGFLFDIITTHHDQRLRSVSSQ